MKKMNNVLIVTYYWPPSAGSGVQRWLKFVKYLPSFGWKPFVYTPDNPAFELKDQHLLADVPEEATIVKRKIWEPYSIHKGLTKGDKSSKHSNAGIVEEKHQNSFKNWLSSWIRGNVFVPDPKVYWVSPSIQFLKEYVKENKIDLIVTTGPPHSMHLIGKGLHEATKIPWIADFRDPWSKLDMLDSYHIHPLRFKKYEKLEKGVLKAANTVLTVSEVWKKDFQHLGANRVEVITNGYDEADFKAVKHQNDKFILSHFGLLNHLRNPSNLWKALAELAQESEGFSKDLVIQLGGSIDNTIIEEIQQSDELKSSLKRFGYVSHEKVLEEYSNSAMLLLLLFDSESGLGNIPGKLFEYLAARKPVLAFGPSGGDSDSIIQRTKSGSFFSYDQDVATIKSFVKKNYDSFKRGEYNTAQTDIEMYSRKSLTQNLSDLMNQTIQENS